MIKHVYRKADNMFCFSSDSLVSDECLIDEALQLFGTYGDSEMSFYVIQVNN